MMACQGRVRCLRGRQLYARAVHGLGKVVLAGLVIGALFWIALAYLHPDLRRAILLSGFGLC